MALLVAVAALVVLGACNYVHGLDETTLVDDPDGDGVDRSIDNCADIANPTQDDTDGDLFGDACDLCPGILTTANHDDDGDGRGDECDVCPGIADFQVDTDGDNVGDACDDFTLPIPRTLFDPLLSIDPRYEGDTQWRVQGDAISPEAPLSSTEIGLRVTSIRLEAIRPWAVHIGARSSRPWTATDVFGIALVNEQGVRAKCFLDCASQPDCFITLDHSVIPSGGFNQTPIPIFNLTFTGEAFSTGTVQFQCGAQNIRAVSADPLGPPAGTPVIIASPNIEITYLEVLQ